MSLAMALRCREVVNVDPSPGMGEHFEASALEAGITNAGLVKSQWMETDGILGDVTIAADVTYFQRDIAAFICKLQTASRRRVMITVWSEPPPIRGANIFELVHGEKQAELCGHRQLLPVLWDMGIMPDVVVLPDPPWWETSVPQTRADAVRLAARAAWARSNDRPRVERLIDEHFRELFSQDSLGYHPLWRSEMRELLITWEPTP